MAREPITGIIPFTYFRGNNKPVGSTVLRVDALTNGNPDFEKWQHAKKYDQLIFQKAYWIEMMEIFEGPMILDLCDPDWIKNGLDIVKIGNLVHAITCSSEALCVLLRSYFPKKMVICVPDRLDLNFYPKPKRTHTDDARILVWFGFIHNAYETLAKFAPFIKANDLKLKIISNLPYTKEDDILELNPEFFLFHHSSAYEHIKTGDIVLNPKSEKSFFKYKSNNKSIISWKLGVPVAENITELEQLINADQRNKQIEKMKSIVEKDYDINLSAQQYRSIFKQVRENYF